MADVEGAIAAILAEAREAVAAGRDPNAAGVKTRIAAVVRGAPGRAGLQADALGQLERIVAVQRARVRLEREPPRPPAAPPAAKRAPLLTKPTVTGTLAVRRAESEGFPSPGTQTRR